jgi:hypothetical protein
MKKKVDLRKIRYTEVFRDYIFPVLAKEFLFSENYEDFAQIVQGHFMLIEKQWESLLIEWEFKNEITPIKWT